MEWGEGSRRFAVTLSAGISLELKPPGSAIPAVHELATFLDRLDGSRRFAVNLWQLPPGQDFERVDLNAWPVHYLQSAGSRDRMTVELRRPEADGDQHYVVGFMPPRETGRTETITWADHSTDVHPTEVFTAAQAFVVFLAYWYDGVLPTGYHLRNLGLT